jgi:hypothetical protein
MNRRMAKLSEEDLESETSPIVQLANRIIEDALFFRRGRTFMLSHLKMKPVSGYAWTGFARTSCESRRRPARR